MKKVLFVILFLCLLEPSAFGAELQRLEFDLGLTRHSTDLAGSRRLGFAFSSDFRVSLVETGIGKFGLEGVPGFTQDSIIANAGIFYEPVSGIQIHLDHTSVVPFSLIPNEVSMSLINNEAARVIGSEMLGVRFILK